MNRFYKILRAVIVIFIAMAVVVPAVLYVGLSLPAVQQRLAVVACDELSGMLGADVGLGALTVSPFNRAMLRDVTVTLDDGRDTVMTVERLGAGINLYELFVHRQIVVNYVEVIGLDLRAHRDSTGAPLNLQPVIDRLLPRDTVHREKHVNLAINTLVLRNSRLSYDVDCIPGPPAGVFSPHHIGITDLSADLRLPAVGSDGQIFEVKRFRLRETSGLEITGMAGSIAITPDSLSWHGVSIDMPRSHVALTDCFIPNPDHKAIGGVVLGTPINAGIAGGSYVTPADLAPLLPVLGRIDAPLSLSLSVDGTVGGESRVALTARLPRRDFDLKLDGRLSHPFDTMTCAVNDLHMSARATAPVFELFAGSRRVRHIIDAAGYMDIDLDGSFSYRNIDATATLSTACGKAGFAASFADVDTRSPKYDMDFNVGQLELGTLLQNPALDIVTLEASASGRLVDRRRPDGTANVDIERLDWHGHRLGDITATLDTHGKYYNLKVGSLDPAARFRLIADGEIDRHEKSVDLAAAFDCIDIGELMPGNRYSGYTLRMHTDADLRGSGIDDMAGRINVHDIRLDGSDGNCIEFNGVLVSADGMPAGGRVMDIESDILSGEVRGDIYLSSLVAQLREIGLSSLPSLAGDVDVPVPTGRDNSFSYNFALHDTEPWADALKLPVSNLGESTIRGHVDYRAGVMDFDFDAPYLRQGNKLIENTRLTAGVDSVTGGTLCFTSRFPTKHGPLSIGFDADATADTVGSRLTWSIDRAARYDGDISLDAVLDRTVSGTHALVTVNPGELTFNDSTWIVNRATVDVSPGCVDVSGINVHRSGQFVRIEGRASALPDDVISVDLLGVNLDYIFESLGIDKVMLGGDATGCFYASNLFSSEPRLTTPGLSVRAISYNKVVLGDALVKSRWDSERRAITLDAVVDQANGEKTLIDGAIFPLNDSLDITFDAHDVDVAFMYPYMSAFASEVSGRASGVARLWGNFKYIDMEGDIAGDNLKIKIAFTNTTYTTSDTVRLRLGEITLDNLTISDMYGNTARLSGKVWHKYFKEPVFDFNITDARNMLVYDETPRNNPDWYGSIYGNGSAHIDGRPGVVNIGVDMSTAPGSVFTFVLNDMEEADDYTFITFRDRNATVIDDNGPPADDVPGTVRRLREMLAGREEGSSSAYNIDLMMDIDANARIDLVMDPVGGDRIRSWGNGNMRMSYGSGDNELHMYGTYTLEHGNYNFTLQDIIIKDFTIKPGSSISFTGDPFSANLDIKAAYPLTANLSDLDESFLQDKDLNRTTVPVNAILQVSGAVQQPEIGFDLEFPTLTQDTYRKVRSIVSTEDMMNRQIIYLLALGRFYTPDYMATASRGNELVSVASSTISSQLGNILGSLSDKWNIAPTFRSDRGDFSDVEVDVALSSSLLNNRLLFNGNFGYRDKSLNNTQFVGDFDIEYLLNRAGTMRLKAYNRYNDMNYYVRTAETTQGVGVSFRRNFDNFTELIRLRHRQERRAAADSIPH